MNPGRRHFLRAAGSLAVAAASCGAAWAQSAANQWFALRGDDGRPVPNLRAPVELVSELEELPGVLWGGGGPSPAVSLVEFYDYNCPWCRGAAEDLAGLMRDNPDLRLGLVHNPILSAESADAARVQLAVLQLRGARSGYELHRRLFAVNGRLSGERALDAAAELGADRGEIAKLAGSAEIRERLRRQMALASSFGLAATPSFVVAGAAVLGYPGAETMTGIVGAARRCGTITC